MAADLLGILCGFFLSTRPWSRSEASGRGRPSVEDLLVVASLPLWLVLFKLNGLYERDEERADHSTADDLFGVIQVVTLGVWSVAVFAYISGTASPELQRLILFWLLTIATVSCFRAFARGICRRHPGYVQRVVVVGEGDIGQLAARKIMQHPEYGFKLLGFLDGQPKARRAETSTIETLGGLDDLQSIVREFDVDRVFVAFSLSPMQRRWRSSARCRDDDVIIDVVPRLFELVGPRADVHSLEGLALVSVPSASLSRSSLLIKRAIDLFCASIALVLFSPFFLFAAYRIQAGLARAGHLQTDEARNGQEALHRLQVPHDEGRYRSRRRIAPMSGRSWTRPPPSVPTASTSSIGAMRSLPSVGGFAKRASMSYRS